MKFAVLALLGYTTAIKVERHRHHYKNYYGLENLMIENDDGIGNQMELLDGLYTDEDTEVAQARVQAAINEKAR